ncbi:MAG: Rieske 2Fe-2S domain-containing protein [Acidimicrobiia bacterium]|nr:Rieske 2Fe-2S domain-containing protein [Acidimicrobiia bacterium]MDH5519719.1 Rieske 2Fe-2S domain-containing protein [Acidimicrobiia bacterium]
MSSSDTMTDTNDVTEMTAPQNRSTTETVAKLDDLAVGEMKMVKVGDTAVALIRSESGVHAIDNACPHQGYGLVTGALADGIVTCQWHNWKFDAATGRCLIGEEDVACHRVDIADGEVAVTVEKPSPEQQRKRLWPSLRRGMENDYVGQMTRDAARLLEAGATPMQIMAEALKVAAPKADEGVGHEMALAADALAIAEVRSGDEAVSQDGVLLALAQGLSGLSETTRGYPVNPVPAGDPSIDVVAAVEAEDLDGAKAGLIGRIERGDDPAVIRSTVIDAVSPHHLGYGHGIIYTQKSFELLDRAGWELAPHLLPHLLTRIVYSTREDTLPYMRRAMRELATIDLGPLAEAAAEGSAVDQAWDPSAFADLILQATDAPISAAADMVRSGAGVDGLLDAVVMAVSERLLRHDLDVEFDNAEPFGWLDVTHGLTTARAARWAWHRHPGPSALRLALYAVWLAFDTGRSERRHGRAGARRRIDGWVGESPQLDGIGAAVLWRRPDDAVTLALSGDPGVVADQLLDASLADRAGSFIVVAHLVKTAQAAVEESTRSGSPLPMAAAARFLAAPRLERFVARSAVESADFVRTGRPPKR